MVFEFATGLFHSMKLTKVFLAYLLSVATTTIVGSVSATQFVLAELPKMNIAVPMGLRVETTVHDILGMSPTFSPIVAVALLVGFLVAGLFTRFLPLPKHGWYWIGGAIAMISALLLVKAALGGTPVAGARTQAGLLAQGFAGLMGGWVFAKLGLRKS